MKRFDIRDRRILYIVLCFAIISVFTLTIAYAALSVTLNITGNAEIKESSWDVYLYDPSITSGSATTEYPSLSEGATKASFSTILSKPGDFYEFTIYVRNDGSIDAMIDSISKTPTLTTEQAKYFNYTVEYANGAAITSKQLVKHGESVKLKVRVEYRKDLVAADLPTSTQTIQLGFAVNYVQSDSTASAVTNNGLVLSTVVLDGVTYYYEDGISWMDWVETGYNTGGYQLSSASVGLPDKGCLYYDGTQEYYGWAIDGTKSYYFDTCHGFE